MHSQTGTDTPTQLGASTKAGNLAGPFGIYYRLLYFYFPAVVVVVVVVVI